MSSRKFVSVSRHMPSSMVSARPFAHASRSMLSPSRPMLLSSWNVARFFRSSTQRHQTPCVSMSQDSKAVKGSSPTPAGDDSAPKAAAAESADVSPPLPRYLHDTYWWAYTTDMAVKVFERPWLVNAILWGNFRRLSSTAIEEVSAAVNRAPALHAPGEAPATDADTNVNSPRPRVLQVACVYGDLTPRILEAVPRAEVTVVDVAPVQVANLCRKLTAHAANRPGVPLAPWSVKHMDATRLGFADESYDAVLLFFLLHEVPCEARTAALAEAFRVAKRAGAGRVVVVDYHKPEWWSPFRYIMTPVLWFLEPFALAVWRNPITSWCPPDAYTSVTKKTYFGGLYQKLVFEVK
eukprot:TRINITY_DN4217_c0_g1_i1.p1 TRINITY_DN4217_c0_g1~~TRINITY_DN4217_c0_g1_i1.p1  ORF type:complete len:351 (+),score=55.48 TRINITY_DN4217_c0_g1_i1:162-1214(+)